MWVLIVLIAVVGAGAFIYNGLVRLREQADAAWADIDVQLRRRHDLVPNLVETVKGYAGHERQTLEAVVQARSQAVDAHTPGERSAAEGRLRDALRSLFVLAEDYPDLRAADSFRDLHRSLAEVEDDLQNARRYYNAVVRDHNTRVQQVPSNLVAGAFGFTERAFFQAGEDARAVPEVSFGEPAR